MPACLQIKFTGDDYPFVCFLPQMNTFASRDQFKPIRIGENLVVNRKQQIIETQSCSIHKSDWFSHFLLFADTSQARAGYSLEEQFFLILGLKVHKNVTFRLQSLTVSIKTITLLALVFYEQ